MQIEDRIDRRSVIILITILVLALTFIASSGVLIYQVSLTKSSIAEKATCIDASTQIKANASKLINQMSGHEPIQPSLIQDSYTIVEDHELTKNHKELAIAKEIFDDYRKINLTKIGFIEKSIFQQKLFTIETICEEVIQDNKVLLEESSQKLNSYWNYTHLTIVIACLLMVILVLVALNVGKTKMLLSKEKSKNKFIFDNSINCISSSDRDGNITDFNPAALEKFGYTLEEIRKLDYRKLYANKEDVVRVKEAMRVDGVFAGEVVNRRKDGSLFVSYLSANYIFDKDNKIIGTMGISRDITSEKEKEQEFQNIINNAQDIIYTVNVQGKFTFTNNSGTSVMGYKNNDLIGKDFTELVHPLDVEKVKQFYIDQYKKKIERSYLEFRGLTKDNEMVWLGQNITTLFSPTNTDEIIGFQGAIRNINQRKEAEEKLKKSEESFRIIVNTINDLFYLFDFRTDRFEYISPNTKEVLGIEQEFFYTGKSYFMEFVHKDDIALCMKAEAQLLRGESYNIEYRLVSYGRTRWIHDRAFPIKNEEGKVISYSGVSRDITDVKSANLIIEQQNEEINQSISYAKNIQESTLLAPNEIQEFYEECFVFFNPRDVLSGDFYILDRFQSNELGGLLAFAIGDCTGHGVPGGMLSFLCNSLLREAFADHEVNSTSEVLNFVREKLIQLFRSNKEKHIHDGMDIALCAMSYDKTTLYFSGANLPVMIIRDGDVFEIKGNRQHVGYSRKETKFSTQIIDIQEGDLIYLFSDGYQDQFGGPNGKKFMKRRLRELLISIHSLPMEDQYDILKLEFHRWKGDLHQVDDVAIMGIRV